MRFDSMGFRAAEFGDMGYVLERERANFLERERR